MVDAKQMGERLQKAMTGRTQAWLAERAGVATSSINGYLRGKMPQADVAMKICDALAIDLRWYLEGVEDRARPGVTDDLLQIPFVDDASRALTFPSGLVSMFGTPLESLCCISVAGTLMEPSLPRGTELLATRHFAEPWDGRVFILQFSGRYVVRRIRCAADGTLLSVCDNPAVQGDVPEYVQPEQVIALGLWASHGL